jgi:hypothetical protein
MQRVYPPGSHFGTFYGNRRVIPPIYVNGRAVPPNYGNGRKPPTKYGRIWHYRYGGGSLMRGKVAKMVDGGIVDHDGYLRPMEVGPYLFHSTTVPDDDLGANLPPREQSGSPDAMSGGNGDHCGGKLLCKVGEYTCLESCTCIPSLWRCDGEVDCAEEEDELECGDDLEGELDDCNSNYGYVRCPRTGKCITEDLLCDGKDDCGDFSDETHCGK